MRRFLMLSLAVLLFAIAGGGLPAYAQITYPEPCSTDCANGGPWNGPTTYVISGPGGCSVIATLRWRSGACGKYEFSIVDFYVPPLIGCSFADGIKGITDWVVQTNPWSWSPTSQGCAENWRMTNGACWSDFDEVSGGVTLRHYQPCSSVNCCYVTFKVCQDAQGVRTKSLIAYGTAPLEQCPPECPWRYCETQSDIFGPNGTKIKLRDEDNEGESNMVNSGEVPNHSVNNMNVER
jgi:hypothetical protein